jgi:predicted nucleotidyltransferase component of viral defense system
VIKSPAITAWAQQAPWSTRAQVEQDLILSRLIVEIANHPYLGRELVFRGGTCLHKLHLNPPRRYSEDLDYVRSTATGIKELMHSLTELGKSLDFDVRTQMSMNPKVYLLAEVEEGLSMRIKVEINTYERSPSNPLVLMHYAVDSSWWSGSGEIQTFSPAELVATKIRALYQRKKGRDLFDLWLALTELRIPPSEILEAFEPYRPVGLTAKLAEENLRDKAIDAEFRNDLNLLVREWPSGYNITDAAELIISALHKHL